MNWDSCFIYNSNKFSHCVFDQLQLKLKEEFQIYFWEVGYVTTLYLCIPIPICFQCEILCCNKLCTISMSLFHTQICYGKLFEIQTQWRSSIDARVIFDTVVIFDTTQKIKNNVLWFSSCYCFLNFKVYMLEWGVNNGLNSHST